MFYINTIKSYRDVLTICDEELLGKTFEEGKLQIHVKENFYSNEDKKPVSEEEAKSVMHNLALEDATFNIVGEKSINVALGLGIIEKETIKEVQGIPYSMVLM